MLGRTRCANDLARRPAAILGHYFPGAWAMTLYRSDLWFLAGLAALGAVSGYVYALIHG